MCVCTHGHWGRKRRGVDRGTLRGRTDLSRRKEREEEGKGGESRDQKRPREIKLDKEQ